MIWIVIFITYAAASAFLLCLQRERGYRRFRQGLIYVEDPISDSTAYPLIVFFGWFFFPFFLYFYWKCPEDFR